MNIAEHFAEHSSSVWMCHRLKGILYVQYIHHGGDEGLLSFPGSGNKLSDRAALGLLDTGHSKKDPEALLKLLIIISEHQ